MAKQDNLHARFFSTEDEMQEFSAWLICQVSAISCARMIIEQAEGDQAKICEGRSLLEFIEKATTDKIDRIFERKTVIQAALHP